MKAIHHRASAGVIILVAALVLALAVQAHPTDEKGFTPLFNGKDLDGWRFHLGQEGAGNSGTFSVKDGVLLFPERGRRDPLAEHPDSGRVSAR
jgi:hypothetical protein